MHGDIVPAEVLVPPETHGRGFRHDDAALVIDGYLRRLAAQEARCRAVLGRLARAFLTKGKAFDKILKSGRTQDRKSVV